jgi:hypothetical protein
MNRPGPGRPIEHSSRVRAAEEELKAALWEEQNQLGQDKPEADNALGIAKGFTHTESGGLMAGAGFNLEHIFSYHAPDFTQLPQYAIIRQSAKFFAQIILDNTPPGADQTASIRKLRECVMTANASIALRGRL